jgi:hypothetical protein
MDDETDGWMKKLHDHDVLYYTSLNPVPNAHVCVFDCTYYKMMLNDVGVHDIILYWFLFSLFLNL